MPKTIVVVGASRGIGEELVRYFAKETSNVVFAMSRDVEKMKVKFVGFENVICISFDLSKAIDEQLLPFSSKFGSIDMLINNAGYLVNKPFPKLSSEDLTLSYQVNVIGVMQTVQFFLPYLNTEFSHIVNISSMGGFQGSVKFVGLSAYSTSKAALCSFTELFSEEYKESTIAMNCLCLGAVQTEMLEEAFPGYLAPVSPSEMAVFIGEFAEKSGHFIRGKIIPISLSTP